VAPPNVAQAARALPTRTLPPRLSDKCLHDICSWTLALENCRRGPLTLTLNPSSLLTLIPVTLSLNSNRNPAPNSTSSEVLFSLKTPCRESRWDFSREERLVHADDVVVA